MESLSFLIGWAGDLAYDSYEFTIFSFSHLPIKPNQVDGSLKVP
jgi:hypothetical protein